MILRNLDFEGVLHVVKNMRAEDRAEVFATQPNMIGATREQQDELVAMRTVAAGTQQGVGYLVCHGDEPVAVIGMTVAWPGVASVWMFATECWPVLALRLTRWAKKAIIPLMQSAEIHRAQCWSLSGHSVAHRWLQKLGATEEAAVPGFGCNGETFHLFAWSKGRDF